MYFNPVIRVKSLKERPYYPKIEHDSQAIPADIAGDNISNFYPRPYYPKIRLDSPQAYPASEDFNKLDGFLLGATAVITALTHVVLNR